MHGRLKKTLRNIQLIYKYSISHCSQWIKTLLTMLQTPINFLLSHSTKTTQLQTALKNYSTDIPIYGFTKLFYLEPDVTKAQFLSRVQLVLNSSFQSLRLVALPRLKNPVWSTIYPLPRRKVRDSYFITKRYQCKRKCSLIQDLNLGPQFHFQR